MGTSLNYDFFKTTLTNLFPNVLATLITVLCVDYLYGSAEKERLSKINKSISDFLYARCTGGLVDIAESIGLGYKSHFLKNEAESLIINNSISKEFDALLGDSAQFTSAFNKSFRESSDRVRFLNDFIKVATNQETVISDNLKKIYPHYSSEAGTLVEGIRFGIGVIQSSRDILSKISDKELPRGITISAGDLQILEKGVNDFYPFLFESTSMCGQTEQLFKNYLLLRGLALKNELFDIS